MTTVQGLLKISPIKTDFIPYTPLPLSNSPLKFHLKYEYDTQIIDYNPAKQNVSQFFYNSDSSQSLTIKLFGQWSDDLDGHRGQNEIHCGHVTVNLLDLFNFTLPPSSPSSPSSSSSPSSPFPSPPSSLSSLSSSTTPSQSAILTPSHHPPHRPSTTLSSHAPTNPIYSLRLHPLSLLPPPIPLSYNNTIFFCRIFLDIDFEFYSLSHSLPTDNTPTSFRVPFQRISRVLRHYQHRRNHSTDNIVVQLPQQHQPHKQSQQQPNTPTQSTPISISSHSITNTQSDQLNKDNCFGCVGCADCTDSTGSTSCNDCGGCSDCADGCADGCVDGYVDGKHSDWYQSIHFPLLANSITLSALGSFFSFFGFVVQSDVSHLCLQFRSQGSIAVLPGIVVLIFSVIYFLISLSLCIINRYSAIFPIHASNNNEVEKNNDVGKKAHDQNNLITLNATTHTIFHIFTVCYILSVFISTLIAMVSFNDIPSNCISTTTASQLSTSFALFFLSTASCFIGLIVNRNQCYWFAEALIVQWSCIIISPILCIVYLYKRCSILHLNMQTPPEISKNSN